MGAVFIAGRSFTDPWQKMLLPQSGDEPVGFHLSS